MSFKIWQPFYLLLTRINKEPEKRFSMSVIKSDLSAPYYINSITMEMTALPIDRAPVANIL